MQKKINPKYKGNDRGAALIEFSTCLPFFLIILLACIDLGNIFVQRAYLAEAIRAEGRRIEVSADLGTNITNCAQLKNMIFLDLHSFMSDESKLNAKLVVGAGALPQTFLDITLTDHRLSCLTCNIPLMPIGVIGKYNSSFQFPLEEQSPLLNYVSGLSNC